MTKITSEQFDELKAQAYRTEQERDVEYSYERLLDADDNEIAFASYHSYRGASFERNDPPRPKAVFDEDGYIINEGWA